MTTHTDHESQVAASPLERFAALEAAGWTRPDVAPFSDLAGPFWVRSEPDGPRFGILIEPKHDNTQNRAHGGLLMTFSDHALGMTARHARPNVPLFTVSFTCHFSSAALVGDFVEMKGETARSTGSLLFMRGECTVGDRTVALCSGVWKAITGGIVR